MQLRTERSEEPTARPNRRRGVGERLFGFWLFSPSRD